jgi:hypothetical protein
MFGVFIQKERRPLDLPENLDVEHKLNGLEKIADST